MQDSTNFYIGAKYNASEIEEADEMPLKFIMAINKYVVPEVGEEISLQEYFRTLTKDSPSYIIWKKLKIQMKFRNLQPEVSGSSSIYKGFTLPFLEGIQSLHDDRNGEKYNLEEISFKKLFLMMLGI